MVVVFRLPFAATLSLLGALRCGEAAYSFLPVEHLLVGDSELYHLLALLPKCTMVAGCRLFVAVPLLLELRVPVLPGLPYAA